MIVGGGTDLWVQKSDALSHADLIYLSRRKALQGIRIEGERYLIGATTTFEEIQDSPTVEPIKKVASSRKFVVRYLM
uniref:Molybdopterin dehydrogenase FAD binding domain-containing protein n=1 Tax=Candidatus Kentrum sp. UNK TaxID=2126344 RepID=A0A451AFY7_9GAMM|nr:MAG: molybdopterin dehydrogenase FAD binding domain-containing protein [Candidatus Kentron sp. UNK]VFK71275.1 MAG: molybdopterin dehydrogenase FAD binding domain-containing protein [Candidatus Kentron sp. UNK]